MTVEELGTHPDYQRTGAATALARWGIDRARADKLDLHLNATIGQFRTCPPPALDLHLDSLVNRS